VEGSFALGGEAPEAALARFEAELGACFARLLAEHDAASAPWDELGALADAFRDRSRELPESDARAHFDWWRRTTGSYKWQSDAELPNGVLSVPLALVPRLYARILELRYAMHRREHPAACDCAALIASGIRREPDSPQLESLGETSDGYHFGTEYRCRACESRWFCGEMDDDSNGVFWEPQLK
jgi:hypothetical protein